MHYFPEPISILVVGAESILALPVIRSLGTLPEVIMHTLSAQNGSRSISERSRYITSLHRFGSTDKEERTNELLAVIEEMEADILLPVEEEYVRWVITLKQRLETRVCLPPLPSLHLFDSLVHKGSLGRLLKRYDFPGPAIHSISSTPAEAGYPCLLKPVRGSSGHGIKRIENRYELIRYLNEINPEKYILQEYIPGEDIGCSLLAEDGDLKALTIQKKAGGEELGVATALEFTQDGAIEEYTRLLLRLTGYSGWANLDFRRDRRDGQVKLLDFNARFWLSLSGSQAAGVDFSRLICRMTLGEKIDRPECRHIRWLMGRHSLLHYWNRLTGRNGHANPVHTDLPERLKDPLPELGRYLVGRQ